MDMHSLYFVGYALMATIGGIVIAKAQYMRKRREGKPINYKLLKIVFGTALLMWTGAALSAVYYTESHTALTVSGILIGIILSAFFGWQINAVIRKIQNDEMALEELATHDSLTGLWIRRILFKTLRKEIANSVDQGTPLSLMMFTVDGLDDIHKEHGYEAGDIVLRKVAKLATKFIDPAYPIYRFRSNTMAIIFANLPPQKAEHITQGLLSEIATHPFEISNGDIDAGVTISATVTAGIAPCSEQTATEQALIDSAEYALFKGMANGNNSIYVI